MSDVNVPVPTPSPSARPLAQVFVGFAANKPLSEGVDEFGRRLQYNAGLLRSGAEYLDMGTVEFIDVEGRAADNGGTDPVPPPEAHEYVVQRDDGKQEVLLSFKGDQKEPILGGPFELREDGLALLLAHRGMRCSLHHPRGSGFGGTVPIRFKGKITDPAGKVFEASALVPRVN